jgi:pyridoxal phosphate enzyme (YggS family)
MRSSDGLIQTDSAKKADAMNKAWTHAHPLKIFLQVNTSGEEAKGGMRPEDCPSVASHIQTHCPKLSLEGVMTIGAFDRDPSLPNPDFIALTQVAQTLTQTLGKPMELSMGMSGDFEQAIQAGSTNVRVGSSLFGEREYSSKKES